MPENSGRFEMIQIMTTILSALAQEIKSSANGYLPPNKISRKNSIFPFFLYSGHYFCALGKQNEKQGLKQCQFYYRKKRRHWYPAIINRYLPASQDSPFLFQVFKYQFLSTTLVLHWTPIFDIQSWQGLKFGKIFLTFRKLSSKDCSGSFFPKSQCEAQGLSVFLAG